MTNYPKPHATFKEHGVTYVKSMVSPEVRQVLEILEKNPGSFLLVKAGVVIAPTPSAVIVLPGQPKINIAKEKVTAICEWLVPGGFEINQERRWELLDTTMDYIRGMERRSC